MRTLLSYWWNLFIVWVKTYCQIKIVHFRQTDGRTWRPKGSNSQKSFSFLNNCRQRALKIFGYDQVDLSFSVWICKMKYHFLDSWYRYNLNSVLNTAFNSYFNQQQKNHVRYLYGKANPEYIWYQRHQSTWKEAFT